METPQDDAISRRAADLAGWLHSVIDIPDSLFGTPPPHGESSHKIHFGIPDAFAKSIREEDYHKYYEPHVVSIGPFHHGKPHLAPMENFKRQAVRILAEMTSVSIEKAYEFFEQDLLRNAKECYDVSRWDRISDPEWCLMMFLDGCFVLVFLFGYLSILSDYDRRRWFSIMKKQDRELVHRDLLLLENQLPFKVLEVLVQAFRLTLPFDFGCIPSSILLKQLMTFSARLYSKLVDFYAVHSHSPAPVHLLQGCRDILVGVLFKEEEKEEIEYPGAFGFEEDLAFCPSFSVTELKKVGIRCSYAMDRRDWSLTHIHFESSILSGHLFLPQLTISEWTLTLFSNLLAYEDSCSMLRKPAAFSSYLNFMSMLINGEEDVKELRARGVLKLDLKFCNDQVVSFFRDITAHTYYNHKDIRKVEQQITAYCESKRLPLRIGYAELKQRYFSGPWSFLVFLAVIFTVSMTVIQTVLTGIQTYK